MVAGIQSALLLVGPRRLRVDYKVTRKGGAIFAETDVLFECAMEGEATLLLTHDRTIPIAFEAHQLGKPFLRFTLI
jgi:hypothetical protein